MGIEFDRGAFENPEDPMQGDDADTTIVVVTALADREARSPTWAPRTSDGLFVSGDNRILEIVAEVRH